MTDQATVEALISDHLLAKEISEAVGRGEAGDLPPFVVTHKATHCTILTNQLDHLLLVKILTLGVEHVKPMVSNVRHRIVART